MKNKNKTYEMIINATLRGKVALLKGEITSSKDLGPYEELFLKAKFMKELKGDRGSGISSDNNDTRNDQGNLTADEQIQATTESTQDDGVADYGKEN